jgi:hypothetical protein
VAAAPDTVDGQWELAEWCRREMLLDLRKTPLRRIIELDPNHAYARRALGYQFLGGQWTTRDDFRRSEGYEFYKGKWRTPQEIEILEERARREIAYKDWLQKLRRHRHDLDMPERTRLAYESLTAVKDPAAVGPLGEMLFRERVRGVKMLYADVLAGINTADAVAVLVERVMHDPDEEMFHYCLKRLLEIKPPHLAEPFILALSDRSNAKVNRSAAALARIGDRGAIAPLIAALITTHTTVLPGRAGASGDTTTATFTEGGHSVRQNEGPRVIISHVRNQHVLDALTRLTGVNYEFDKERWHYWHAQEKKAQETSQPLADTRRQ